MAGVVVEECRVEAGGSVSLSTRIFRAGVGGGGGDGDGEKKKDVALVLVHQMSLLGGCQALMKGMAIRLAQLGYTVLTFDLRGAGKSSGSCTLTGSSEVNDVIAVCKWAAQRLPASRILLVGSSAGAPIAGSAVDQIPEVVGYVSFGYPFGMLASILYGRHHKAILQSQKPKLFVMGTNDGFTSVKQLESKLKTAVGRVESHLIPGAGHFQMEGPDYDEQMSDLIDKFSASL